METMEKAMWRKLIRLEQRDRKLFGMIHIPSDGPRYQHGCNRHARVRAVRLSVQARIAEMKALLAPRAPAGGEGEVTR